MGDVNREYLARQLKELSDWADYLHLSLTVDQPFERGKIRLLESIVPKEDLDQIRFELRTVQYRLANLSYNLGVPAKPLPVPAEEPASTRTDA